MRYLPEAMLALLCLVGCGLAVAPLVVGIHGPSTISQRAVVYGLFAVLGVASCGLGLVVRRDLRDSIERRKP